VRLHMLDHFINALAFPRQDLLTLMPRIPCPSSFPDRLKHVRTVHFICGTIAYGACRFLIPSRDGPAQSTNSKGCCFRRRNPSL
jgi:hypothetical protein